MCVCSSWISTASCIVRWGLRCKKKKSTTQVLITWHDKKKNCTQNIFFYLERVLKIMGEKTKHDKTLCYQNTKIPIALLVFSVFWGFFCSPDYTIFDCLRHNTFATNHSCSREVEKSKHQNEHKYPKVQMHCMPSFLQQRDCAVPFLQLLIDLKHTQEKVLFSFSVSALSSDNPYRCFISSH